MLYNLFIGDIGSFEISAYKSIPVVLWAGLFAGPLGEELGWRGFLLPELKKRFSDLTSGVINGVIWFCWHIPLFWFPFGTLVSGDEITILPLLNYFLIIICLSIIITWLGNISRGSVFVAVLFHLSINAGLALLFFPELNAAFKKVHLLSLWPMLVYTTWLIVKKKLYTKKSNV